MLSSALQRGETENSLSHIVHSCCAVSLVLLVLLALFRIESPNISISSLCRMGSRTLTFCSFNGYSKNIIMCLPRQDLLQLEVVQDSTSLCNTKIWHCYCAFDSFDIFDVFKLFIFVYFFFSYSYVSGLYSKISFLLPELYLFEFLLKRVIWESIPTFRFV